MHGYTEVKTSRKFEMAGKGAVRDTVFGVLGATKYDAHAKTLGGLVKDTKPGMKAPVVSEKMAEKMTHNTDRHILGPAAKTHIAGAHFGQVPFAGAFMGPVGHSL